MPSFVQASSYTEGRPSGPPIWIVIHDMEAGEFSGRAESTAQYFAAGAGGRQVSSHYCVDDDSVVQCVSLDDTAWTVGNWQGNNLGINWELSGFASQGEGEWLDDFGLAMFAQMVPVVRADAERFGIPLEKRTVAELRAFVPGVTSHWDLGVAFGGTDHTDPGPNFPWDTFLDIMRGASTEKENAMAYLARDTQNRMVVVTDDWNGWYRPPQANAAETQQAIDDRAYWRDRMGLPAERWVSEDGKTQAKFNFGVARTNGLFGPDLGAVATGGAAVDYDRIQNIVDDELDEQSRSGADAD